MQNKSNKILFFSPRVSPCFQGPSQEDRAFLLPVFFLFCLAISSYCFPTLLVVFLEGCSANTFFSFFFLFFACCLSLLSVRKFLLLPPPPSPPAPVAAAAARSAKRKKGKFSHKLPSTDFLFPHEQHRPNIIFAHNKHPFYHTTLARYGRTNSSRYAAPFFILLLLAKRFTLPAPPSHRGTTEKRKRKMVEKTGKTLSAGTHALETTTRPLAGAENGQSGPGTFEFRELYFHYTRKKATTTTTNRTMKCLGNNFFFLPFRCCYY